MTDLRNQLIELKSKHQLSYEKLARLAKMNKIYVSKFMAGTLDVSYDQQQRLKAVLKMYEFDRGKV